ncbi:hypothetical protein SAMN05192566_0247 [Methylophilus rhizosphaerae]|uniref:Uncharacterized protein n=1 Tax=Methylophilus rhizosphaerae TaxID=492660 RepID=A0A1G8ZE39_9PROT|nr:hypothetical protein [Methylophilus rhizosphaerae]SDK13213.1 hypothetical protein SAMN05192566_0247 [Methylophilus rhizosphaerae]
MRVFLCFTAMVSALCSGMAVAADEAELVVLVETEDALCLAHGGKLVSLQLNEAAMPARDEAVEVWVDRWFMQVQTADHTRHVLTAADPATELGCSYSMAGPQHWTLSTIKRLLQGGAAAHKE